MLRRVFVLAMLGVVFSNFGATQLILISRNDEIAIGREVAKAIEKEYGVWDNPEQTNRIERIGKSLVDVCDRKNMPYTFKILKEEKELNAITAPGGFIYITKALLEALENDDEVAFVLGHEIGHVCGDHIRKQISQAIAGSLLLNILTGGSSQLLQLGTDIMFALYRSGYSRQHERDADARGIRYMKAAGYNPIAAITALKKLGMERYKGIVKWFATHPEVPERVKRIGAMLGVDPETLQPLPQSGTAVLDEMPKRSSSLLFITDGGVSRLAPDAKSPQQAWQLKDRIVEGVQSSPDGKTLWLLVRRKGSSIVHFARSIEGQRRTEFLASLDADVISDFRRSSDGRWFVVLAKHDKDTFIKLFDANGKDVPLPDRTPTGKVLALTWLSDNRLLLLSERFGETSFVLLKPEGTAQFVSVGGIRPQSASLVTLDRQTVLLLMDGTLQQLRWEGEQVAMQTLLQGVTTFDATQQRFAIVKDGKLQVGTWTSGQWQGEVLDERVGEWTGLDLSSDGQWLAYAYRAKPNDTAQLWLAHLQSKRLWRVAVNATKHVFVE